MVRTALACVVLALCACALEGKATAMRGGMVTPEEEAAGLAAAAGAPPPAAGDAGPSADGLLAAAGAAEGVAAVELPAGTGASCAAEGCSCGGVAARGGTPAAGARQSSPNET